MDSLEMREMLMSMGKNTPCPLCRASIPASKMEIKGVQDSSCLIDFSCPKCKEQFSGQAFIQKIDPSANTLNVSSRVMNEAEHAENISKNEVQAVHNILEKNISFGDIFQKK